MEEKKMNINIMPLPYLYALCSMLQEEQVHIQLFVWEKNYCLLLSSFEERIAWLV